MNQPFFHLEPFIGISQLNLDWLMVYATNIVVQILFITHSIILNNRHITAQIQCTFLNT